METTGHARIASSRLVAISTISHTSSTMDRSAGGSIETNASIRICRLDQPTRPQLRKTHPIIMKSMTSSAQGIDTERKYRPMMLAKLTATLPTSSAPETTRMTPINPWAPRTRLLIMTPLFMGCPGESVLGGDGADFEQHLVHGRLVFGHVVGDAAEQRLHLGEVLRRQGVNLAAHFHPVVRQLLGEIHLPGLHRGLDGLSGIDDDLLQIGRQRVEPGLADDGERHQHRVVGDCDDLDEIIHLETDKDRKPADRAVDGPLTERGHHLAQRHRYAGGAELAHLGPLERGAVDPDLLAVEIRKPH